MDSKRRLVVAMAEKLRRVVSAANEGNADLPKTLQPPHILWMCDQIEKHAESNSITKSHRWIGFIQGAIVANRMLKLDELRAMFDQAKAEEATASESVEDLTDHLDPQNSFEFDIGGQG